MYIYVQWYYSGIDFVRKTYEQGFSEWDLIFWDNIAWICIWDNISFVERYEKERAFPCKQKNIRSGFFSPKTMELIHRMVKERFTTYKKVFPLFIPKNWLKYLDICWEKSNPHCSIFQYSNWFFEKTKKKRNWQQLFVFPDLRTIKNSFPNSIFEEENVAIIYSSMTDRQKMIISNEIKNWSINTLLATSSEIFQDWKDLKYIYFVDWHKRYYDNFQDPRFKISEVLKKISEIYQAPIEICQI